jgi:hypothetical protein
LGDEVVHHLRVGDPVDWEEEEHFTGYERCSQLVDEPVVPCDFVLPHSYPLQRGLRFIQIEAITCCDPESLEAVFDYTSLGWFDNVSFLSRY